MEVVNVPESEAIETPAFVFVNKNIADKNRYPTVSLLNIENDKCEKRFNMFNLC